MAFFAHDNAEIWYELRGETGPVVTLINGHTRTLNDYDLMSAGLLAAGYRVLVFDNRGSGKTRSSLKFSCFDMINDLTALWMHLGITRSHLIGFSMGGYLAQAVTISHPDKINHLVLLSTAAGNHHVNHEVDSWITDTGSGLEAKLRNFFSPQFQADHPEYMAKMIDLTRRAVEDGRFLARSAAQKEALFQFDVNGRLHEITCPVLLVHGRSDKSVLPAAADELHSRLKNSRLIWLEDTAHFCIIERPDAVLAAITDFLP